MAGRSEIRDLIVAAAQGAAGGLEALRSADAEVRLEDFEVEMGFDPDGASDGLSAAVRFTFAARTSAGNGEVHPGGT